MKIIDISWPLSSQTTAYKDKKTIAFTSAKNFDEHKVRESLITLSSHSGTHIDAPAHFLQNGATTDQMPLASICGPCIVLDMTHVKEQITQEDLQSQSLKKDIIVVFKTKNSALSSTALFDPSFIYLNANAAKFLINAGVKAIGIDYLGIERNQPNHETHIALLENNIPIIEGLRLQDVQPDNYTLICLPLALQGLDGAPARAILID